MTIYMLLSRRRVANGELKLYIYNFPKTSNLSKISNKNTVKLSYSCMPSIFTLISGGNGKKLKRNKNTEPPNLKCIKKENCPPPQGKMLNRVCSV